MAILGPPNVAKLDARGHIEGLIGACKYKKDAAVREEARLALERRMPLLLDTFQSRNVRHIVLARDAFRLIGEPAVPFLADVVDHGDTGRRQDAVHVLGEIGLPSAVEPLKDSLRDHDSGVRLLAVRSLAKLEGEHVDELLRSALRDRDPDVRLQASKVLQKRGTK